MSPLRCVARTSALLHAPQAFIALVESKRQGKNGQSHLASKQNAEVIFPRANLQRYPGIFALMLITGFLLIGPVARAADDLLPPFGFRWNDSMPRVEAVLN